MNFLAFFPLKITLKKIFNFHLKKREKTPYWQNLLNPKYSKFNMSTKIEVNREAIMDLIRVKGEFDSIVESIELMMDKEFMDSYNKSKEQIKNKEFDDWNAL